MALEITGVVNEQGRLSTHQQAEINAWFQNNRGRQVKVKFAINHRQRSNNQNGYYWACIIPMIKNAVNLLGNEWDDDDTHTALKSKFNAVEIVNKDGVVEELADSTAKMNTVEFEEYMEKIRRWADEFLMISIPLPNEQSSLRL